MSMYDKVQEALEAVRARTSLAPQIGIVLGSGLGGLVEEIRDLTAIDYSEIPHFPVSTVKGHAGRLVFGDFRGRNVVMMEGRPHYYEGHGIQKIALPVYLLKALGVEKLFITNACGGINRNFEPGTLMIIEDFINLTAMNPLIGPNDDRLGPRFPDMTEPYDRELISTAKAVADRIGVSWSEGVYAGFPGPYFETRAEIRMIAGMGADAVGMSTVPETIVANHAGMKCFAVACITNMATGIQQGRHSHEKVLETARKASADLKKWIGALVEEIE